MRLLWSALTGFHDWSAGDRAPLRELIQQARQAGLVGEIDRGADTNDKSVSSPDGESILEKLLAGKAKRNLSYRFEVGGERPRPWQLNVLLARWNEEDARLRGYNNFRLSFESAGFAGAAGSDRLIDAFRAMHTPQNTEFASIHPYERWGALTNIHGPYEEPLTIGPMFAGVSWASFLGPQHLKYFDEAKLKSLSTYRFELRPGQSLFMQVSPDVAQATSPEVEAEMFRLTDAFRAALR